MVRRRGASISLSGFSALILGFGVSVLVNKLISRTSFNPILVNFLIFSACLGVSAWLWAKEPVKPDFLVTQPVAPNYEMYPDYDARNYDVMSQFAVIGQGINNHISLTGCFTRPSLTYLHDAVGQDYSKVMAPPGGIFAIIPALIFNRRYALQPYGWISLAILTALRVVELISISGISSTLRIRSRC